VSRRFVLKIGQRQIRMLASSGSVAVAGSAATLTYTPVTAQTADPTLLPVATKPGQTKSAVFTYGRTLSSGQTYVDPTSGITVLKVTDATQPASNSPGTGHGYAAGGPRISQEWESGGVKYHTLALEEGDLVDVRHDTMAMSNWRSAPYGGETDYAWSLDPATPRILYFFSGTNIVRYDTASMATANVSPFPIAAGSAPVWLQTQLNDTWIAWMDGTTYKAYKKSTSTLRQMSQARSGASHDELHIDLEYAYVYMSTNADAQANAIWNLEADTFIINPSGTTPGAEVISDDHATGMRGLVVSVAHWQSGGGAAYLRRNNTHNHFITDPTDFHEPGGDWYNSCQWCINMWGPAETDQWFVADKFRDDSSGDKIRLGMIALVRLNGDVRILCAHDCVNSGNDYGDYTQPTQSPDGKFVMWTSDMNNSTRRDVFLARVPVS
jgi:hypothetical protein